jgi:hypothetical protein
MHTIALPIKHTTTDTRASSHSQQTPAATHVARLDVHVNHILGMEVVHGSCNLQSHTLAAAVPAKEALRGACRLQLQHAVQVSALAELLQKVQT